MKGYTGHLRTIAWFLRDAWRVSRKATTVAVAAELVYFAIQALAYGLLVSALANPGSLLSSRGQLRFSPSVLASSSSQPRD